MLIWYAKASFSDVFMQVQFVESAWRLGNTSGRQPTSDEMIRVLSHLTSLRIRAKWTTSSPSTFLGDIVLTLSNRYLSENFETKARVFWEANTDPMFVLERHFATSTQCGRNLILSVQWRTFEILGLSTKSFVCFEDYVPQLSFSRKGNISLSRGDSLPLE